jgi:hypothetical protein
MIPTPSRVVSILTAQDYPRMYRAVTAHSDFSKRIPGWSLPCHASFFSAVCEALRPSFTALICGVYHGLDLALLRWAARDTRTLVEITGVDLFSDSPCADWTPEQVARGSWQGNGFGPPPSIEAARLNAPEAEIIRSHSVEYMKTCGRSFDFIYLDTSHDYTTVRDEIAAARNILTERAILAGDDYMQPCVGWGVDRAVCESLPHHVGIASRIWLAT